jgi:acetyl-CoA acyltransferase
LVESAEKLAKEAGIRREAQDAFAHRSHQRAAAAWSSGRFEGEVMPIFTGAEFTTVVRQDNAVRQESNLSEYGKFSPVFDKKYGTVTLANSCATTDGAGALLLMTESAAKERGVRPLGYLRSWAYAALDPDDSPLLGPAHATPKALAEAGLSFQNLSLVEMHEASAAQVLSNQEAFASRSFASRQLGMGQAIGDLHEEILNVNGGSLAMGHPAAATGTRMVMQLLHELRRRGGGMGLVTTSALGGLGAALVVEVDS